MRTEVGSQKSEIRGQRTEIRSQRSEVRSQRTEVGRIKMYILSEKHTKFHLKSVPLINAYLWRDKTILQRKKYDKYDKQTRDHNSLLSPRRL